MAHVIPERSETSLFKTPYSNILHFFNPFCVGHTSNPAVLQGADISSRQRFVKRTIPGNVAVSITLCFLRLANINLIKTFIILLYFFVYWVLIIKIRILYQTSKFALFSFTSYKLPLTATLHLDLIIVFS